MTWLTTGRALGTEISTNDFLNQEGTYLHPTLGHYTGRFKENLQLTITILVELLGAEASLNTISL